MRECSSQEARWLTFMKHGFTRGRRLPISGRPIHIGTTVGSQETTLHRKLIRVKKPWDNTRSPRPSAAVRIKLGTATGIIVAIGHRSLNQAQPVSMR